MRRVLIAGCGYVGAVTARLFQRAGWSVEGWTRSGRSEVEEGDGFLVRAVDLGDWKQVEASPGSFDLIIHSASSGGGGAESYRRVYLEGARHLGQRFPEGALIFVSSTSVYGQRTGEWVTEESPAEPETETGRILREAEGVALEQGGRVARLAGLYGPGRSALLQRVLRGEAVIDPHQDRYVNQLHRDDAAAALFFLGQNREAMSRQIYNVSDDEPLLLSECYRWLANRLGRPAPPAEEAPSSSRRRGESNKRVRNTRLREAGWAPIYSSFREGMEKSVLPAWK